MGNFCAKEKETTKQPPKPRGPPAATRGKMSYQLPELATRTMGLTQREASRDPDDYAAEKLKDAVWVRLPGQINDQRINVEDCHGTTFVLLDNCDSVQVDDCTDCIFFIGPTCGSVFLRGCKDCRFVVLCGQLRLRDCFNCDLALLSRSRPVLESSAQIGIGCFVAPQYLALRVQLARARLSTLNNRYAAVHDFTPKPGNYHIMSRERSAALFASVAKYSGGEIGDDEEQQQTASSAVVPYTTGASGDAIAVCLVCRPGCFSDAEELVYDVAQQCPLAQTAEVKLNAAMLQDLRAVDTDAATLADGDVVVMIAATADLTADFTGRSCVLFALRGKDAARAADVLLNKDDGFGSAL